jgi:hypothetical protein
MFFDYNDVVHYLYLLLNQVRGCHNELIG